jgi:serine/threonine-protein kinase
LSRDSAVTFPAAAVHEGIPVAEIRSQVEKICASRGFVHSERLSRFLRYAVDHALLGESDQLKEYLVGVEVCDRKDSYDTRIDPIVRVEARRLRTRLTEYYDGEGLNDPIVIEFLKGSYAPAFHFAAIRGDPSPELGGAPARDSKTTVKLTAGVLAALAIAAVLLVRTQGSAPVVSAPPPLPSIALLPVVNLTGSDADSYFAQGLTEELISAFAKTPRIRVVAPSSLFEVKRMAAELQGGRDGLKVNSVLQCSIRKAGERVRLTAHLTHAGDGSSIWAETYEREVEDAFFAQEQLAGDIVSAVQQKLLGSIGAPSETHQSADLEAHNLYLKGRYYWNKRTEEGLKTALDCFRQAIAKEKNYAKGYVGLADALATLGNYGVLPPRDVMPKAKEAALKGLEIDPDLAEARVSLGFVLALYDWDWKAAETEFRRALTLRPSYAMGRKWYATAYLLSLGRAEEAITELKRAEELDPLSPILRTSLSYAFYAAGQYDLAVEQSRESLEMHPGFYLEYWNLGLALEQQGKLDEAVTALEKSDTLAEGSPYVLGSLGHAYARAGRIQDAETVLTELKRLAGERYIPSTDLALVELGLGRTANAFRWLQKGHKERCMALVSLKVDPRFNSIRERPEFGELLGKMGLEAN